MSRRGAKNDGGHERHFIRLENVGCHAGAVSNVVSNVVCNRGWVSRVVLWDARFNLTDKVGANVGSLREDATTDAHEERGEGATKSKPDQELGCVFTREIQD